MRAVRGLRQQAALEGIAGEAHPLRFTVLSTRLRMTPIS